jgi:chloramphenicol 3-O phosphotransferase
MVSPHEAIRWNMKTGHVIFLNGTSSSGKTTIAKALQDKLAEPYMYVSIDNYFHMYPERFLHPNSQEDAKVLDGLVPAVISGLHKSVAALARAGNNVLVDHVLQMDGSLKECVGNWVGLDVLFVGVKCPLKIAEKREKKRGDRNIGTARHQFELVHAHALYDIEIDTSRLTVAECVARIIKLINEKPKKSAFQELAARFMISNESTLPRPETG